MSIADVSSSSRGGVGEAPLAVPSVAAVAPPSLYSNQTDNNWLGLYSLRISARNRVESEPFAEIAVTLDSVFRQNLRLQRLQEGIFSDVSLLRKEMIHEGKSQSDKTVVSSLNSLNSKYIDARNMVKFSISFGDVSYFTKTLLEQKRQLESLSAELESSLACASAKDAEIAALKQKNEALALAVSHKDGIDNAAPP